TALMWAIDDLEKARLLIEHGADVNVTSIDSRTPMTIVLGIKGSAAVVNLLLNHGANLDAPSYRGRSMFAGAGGDEAVLRTLLDHGVEVARLSPGLPTALASDCTACVHLLIPSVPKAALS